MDADQRLKLVRRKIERADEHIANLKNVIKWFLDSKPYKIGTRRNPETRQLVYYLTSVAGTPHSFAAITGDILMNLRSALDHLAQSLYLVGTGGQDGFRDKTAFLISPSAKDFESGLPRKVEGMRQEAIDAIRALQPYKGGNGEDLWTFHRLNNIDKHRMIVTVGASFRSLNLGPMMMKMVRDGLPADWPGKHDIPDLDLFLRPADTMFPLKQGDELFIDAADAEPNEKTEFRFEIVIHEPGVLEGQPILETLIGFRDRVSNIVDAFRPLLG